MSLSRQPQSPVPSFDVLNPQELPEATAERRGSSWLPLQESLGNSDDLADAGVGWSGDQGMVKRTSYR